jgi:dihydrofolate reductase
MARVIYYVTSSLDGFVARKDGGIDWLLQPIPEYGFDELMNSVDAIAMGRKTFEQSLQFGQPPGPHKPTFVFSRTTSDTHGHPVEIVQESPRALCDRLGDARIFLMGGGALARSFADDDVLHEIDLFLQPIVLGDGIPLFDPLAKDLRLELVEVTAYRTGMVRTRYSVGSQA